MTQADKEVWGIVANSLFDAVNTQTGNALPKIQVEIGSNSMTRCAGKIYYSWRPRSGWNPVELPSGKTVHAIIRLSPVWMDKGHAHDILTETLKHEMAHLGQLVTRGVTDHGPSFREWCIKVGCNPATYHNLGCEAEDGKHVYWCRECGHISRYTRNVDRADGGTCEPCTRTRRLQVKKVYLGTVDQIVKTDLIGALRDKRDLAVHNWNQRVAAEGGVR